MKLLKALIFIPLNISILLIGWVVGTITLLIFIPLAYYKNIAEMGYEDYWEEFISKPIGF